MHSLLHTGIRITTLAQTLYTSLSNFELASHVTIIVCPIFHLWFVLASAGFVLICQMIHSVEKRTQLGFNRLQRPLVLSFKSWSHYLSFTPSGNSHHHQECIGFSFYYSFPTPAASGLIKCNYSKLRAQYSLQKKENIMFTIWIVVSLCCILAPFIQPCSVSGCRLAEPTNRKFGLPPHLPPLPP